MKNRFKSSEEVAVNKDKIQKIIESHELKYLPSVSADSKDGLVLEVNCFPAAAEIYKEGFVQKTVEAAIKMSNLQKSPLEIVLLIEDFTQHAGYLKNAEKWFEDISKLNGQQVRKRTFKEFGNETASLIVSNSDLRFEDAARKIILSGIPCFPSQYAGWWRRSKIGTSKQIDGLCESHSLNPSLIQPDYSYVVYEEFCKEVFETLKKKTGEMLEKYPKGVFVKQAAGTQGYGGMYISSIEDYNKKDVRETLSIKRGFRGSKIHGFLIQRCLDSMNFNVQTREEELKLIREEEMPAEFYFIMVADANLRASIYEVFLRIGPTKANHNLNKPGEFFKRFQLDDLVCLGLSEEDFEAAHLSALFSYVATDIQIKKFVENPDLDEKTIYSLKN